MKTITLNYDDYLNLERELNEAKLRIKYLEKNIPVLMIYKFYDTKFVEDFTNVDLAEEKLKKVFYEYNSELSNLKKELERLSQPWYKRLFS